MSDKPLGAWITCKECGSRSWVRVSSLPGEVDALRARLAAADKVAKAFDRYRLTDVENAWTEAINALNDYHALQQNDS